MSAQQSKAQIKWQNLEQVGQPDPKGGLRITMIPGVPGTWQQAVKYCAEYLNLDYIRMRHPIGEANQDYLYKLTAQKSVPTVIYNDERPRSSWIEQISLFQRISDEKNDKDFSKRLIPLDANDRIKMTGLLFQLAGEMGLMYNYRYIATDDESFLKKYPGDRSHAEERVKEGMQILAQQLQSQKKIGSKFFIGTSPTALDFYWAAFSLPFSIPDSSILPLSDPIRELYQQKKGKQIDLPEILLQHRNLMLKDYIQTPIKLGNYGQ